MAFWVEERYHTSTDCTFQEFSTNGTTNCTYTLPNCNKKVKPCITRQVTYDLASVTVTFEWTNYTSNLALVFEHFRDAKLTNFKYVYAECNEGSNLSIYNFVNNLMERKLFKCYVHPDKLDYVYLNSSYHYCFVVIGVCIGHIVLLVLFCAVDAIMYNKQKDVLFYIKRHKVMKVQRKLKVENVKKRLNFYGSELTPLLISSSYGYDDIMEYLCSIGADLDCCNLNNGKTVFHYACESHRKTAIRWCIAKELPINIRDQQRRTPLITYAQTLFASDPGSIILGWLIDAGADVTAMDKSGTTALHYICRNKKIQSDVRTDMIKMLVNAGCLSELFMKKRNDSPLSILLKQHQYSLCFYLIEAGYDLLSDSGLMGVLTNSKDMPEGIKNQLNEEVENAAPLMRLCRTVIRKSIGGILLEKRIVLLPIPSSIKNYLLLKD